MAHAQFPEESKLRFRFTPGLRNLAFGLMGIGLLLILAQFIFPWQGVYTHSGDHQPINPRFFSSILLASQIAIPLGLGAIFFLAINFITGAAWNVSLRRIAEAFLWYLPIGALLTVIVFFGIGDTFHLWVHAPADDHLVAHKAGWLNVPFFTVRNVIIMAIWCLFGWIIWKKTHAQEQDGSLEHTKKLSVISAVFLIVFGLTYTSYSFDMTMSLYPHWFSTMWGIYIFAGMALTFYAAVVLWVWYLKRSGYYGDALNENHVHDLGKYIWGHTIFWAYIGFSQYMLIWYAHIPEETIWYRYRLFEKGTGELVFNTWAIVSLTLYVVRFILPFFLLMKRSAKRNLNYLAAVSLLVLVGQVIDMYWIIYPTIDHGYFIMFSWQELGPLLLLAGSFIFVVGTALSRTTLISRKDPRLEACLHHHQ